MKADAVAHAQPRVKIQQVDAAAQQNVLAVVDRLRLALGPGGQVVGRGAPARKRPRFEHFHLESGAAQRRRRRQTGQPAARNQNFGHISPSLF